MTNHHISVLLEETIENLLSRKDGSYFDGTIGFGGHAEAILKKLDLSAKYLATDKDSYAFEYCRKKFENDERVCVYNTGFLSIDVICKLDNVDGLDGILLDLGVSSYQFDDSDAGFTYRKEAMLDLRMNKNVGRPAYEFINELSEQEIANIIYNYGEEVKSRHIARRIVEFRNTEKLKTSTQLNEIIEKVIGKKNLNKSLSRVYQAFRIYVNNEIEELKQFLEKSINLLNPGGRMAIISFHSLEDRIVKEFFKYESLNCICPPQVPVCVCNKKQRMKIITRKPLIASQEELEKNIRARSAKLRVAEKL